MKICPQKEEEEEDEMTAMVEKGRQIDAIDNTTVGDGKAEVEDREVEVRQSQQIDDQEDHVHEEYIFGNWSGLWMNGYG